MSYDHGNIARPISISPPPKRRRVKTTSPEENLENCEVTHNEIQDDHPSSQQGSTTQPIQGNQKSNVPASKMVPSPVQLNFVEDLPNSGNVDTVSLGSILGNVMIRECWLFNYLFDLDFVMSQIDPDIRNTVELNIVHGSWRREDQNKINIDNAARRYKNINVITAYMPEPFGTHHSKMIILFRRDDLAQVIILTGNFIERDWCMSQAIWKSPLLPMLNTNIMENPITHPIGCGPRFKSDLTAYLKTYGAKLKDLIVQIDTFDFSHVKAALIASTPGKQNLASTDPETETLWGWPRLKQVLSVLPVQKSSAGLGEATEGEGSQQKPHVAIQVSSIASLGANWLPTVLFPALSAMKKSTLETAGSAAVSRPIPKPRFSIIFPTADTIRKSVNGYASGSSIHMKTQTPAQSKQLSELRPMLCHWAGISQDPKDDRAAGRGRAAPHIKTYVRFSDSSMHRIDWAMVTSANLSTQAWGAARSASGEVRICSYEIGVVVWPAMWKEGDDDEGSVRMVPVFGQDTPMTKNAGRSETDMLEDAKSPVEPGHNPSNNDVSKHSEGEERAKRETIIGWRMPYDLPLVPYEKDEMPWCASEPCGEPDWLGRIWPGYQK